MRCEVLWERAKILTTIYKQEREAKLLAHVKDAVERFRDENQPFTLTATGQVVGMAIDNLKRYPKILAYLNTLPELPTPFKPPKR